MIDHPELYLPIARWRYPGPSPAVIEARTELVIDGYTRSANTFVVYALQLAQPRPIRLAHHLHAPAQLLEAVRRGVPALALIREPEGAVLSQVQWEPGVSIRAALITYARFYRRLLPVADHLVIGEFCEVTADPGAAIDRVNERYGTEFERPDTTPEFRERVLRSMRERSNADEERYRTALRFESGSIGRDEFMRAAVTSAGTGERTARRRRRVRAEDSWLPSVARAERGRHLRERYRSPELAEPRAEAERMYAAFAEGVDAVERYRAAAVSGRPA